MPLLDLINCRDLATDVARDGHARIHRTDWDGAVGDAGSAVTLAPRAWRAGEQVFEDYGQPNHVLCV